MRRSLHHPASPRPHPQPGGAGRIRPPRVAQGAQRPGGAAHTRHLPAAARPAQGRDPTSWSPAAEAPQWRRGAGGGRHTLGRWRREGRGRSPAPAGLRGSGSSPHAAASSRGNLGRREPRPFLVSGGIGGHGQGCCKVSNEIRGVKHYKLSSAVARGRAAITAHPRALPRRLPRALQVTVLARPRPRVGAPVGTCLASTTGPPRPAASGGVPLRGSTCTSENPGGKGPSESCRCLEFRRRADPAGGGWGGWVPLPREAGLQLAGLCGLGRFVSFTSVP